MVGLLICADDWTEYLKGGITGNIELDENVPIYWLLKELETYEAPKTETYVEPVPEEIPPPIPDRDDERICTLIARMLGVTMPTIKKDENLLNLAIRVLCLRETHKSVPTLPYQRFTHDEYRAWFIADQIVEKHNVGKKRMKRLKAEQRKIIKSQPNAVKKYRNDQYTILSSLIDEMNAAEQKTVE